MYILQYDTWHHNLTNTLSLWERT